MVHGERSLTVLVVDDEALLRWSIAEMLRRSAHAVIEAASAQEARAALASASAPVDVVILDYRLPDSRDLQLLDEIRRRFPPPAVVLMTAFGTRELEQQAVAHGAFCVLNKPFDLLAVEPLIRKVSLATRDRRL